jgi:hypothetical protein
MKNEHYYVLFFVMTLLVFYIITGEKPSENSHPYFKNGNMPIKLICRATDYLNLEDYIYDNFRELEIIFFSEDDPYITCEKDVYYVSLVCVPYVINTKQYYEYKIALRNKNDDMHKLPIIARVGPIVQNDCNIALLNTEHLSNKMYLDHIDKYVPLTMDIYDFSKKNIELLGRGRYIPYVNNRISTNMLKFFIKQRKQKDVCIIGTISNRRTNIINKLAKKGISTDYISDDFRISRDRRVGQCKLLVNIHMYDHTNNYEALRCERWRFAGMPIISEMCIDEVPEGVITCDYDNIVNTVEDVLRKMNN